MDKYQPFDDETEQEEIIPWTAEQARAWREANPTPSLWRLWRIQVAVGGVLVLLVWLLQMQAGWRFGVVPSAAFGVLAVLGPSALATAGVLRGWRRQMQAQRKVGGAGLSFVTILMWEGFKVLFTIALLALAPQVLREWMSWPAMLAGFVVTLKAYWWAWIRGQARAH